jgi:xanthine dehydrogenase small subunit
LDARLVLASLRGERRIAIDEFYTGYRKNVMAADEVLTRIEVPLPHADESLRIYKVSKRQDDDISAVCLAIALRVQDGRITYARIGAGGVAATPVRAPKAEAALSGQPWTLDTVEHAAGVLSQEFKPLSDMRASAEYRRGVLGQLLLRYWEELQGGDREPVLLENLT